jgi:two-component system sensor histidine kinase GlrK
MDVEDIVVEADRDKIATVFDNLLSNAIKFTPPGGVVSIRGRANSDGFVLDFADTGPGIPDNESPRIFDAFFQGNQEQGGHVAGTGIGLSVVQECIQAHDGTVELVNSDEFSGAHFRIFVPQRQQTSRPKIAANA